MATEYWKRPRGIMNGKLEIKLSCKVDSSEFACLLLGGYRMAQTRVGYVSIECIDLSTSALSLLRACKESERVAFAFRWLENGRYLCEFYRRGW